MSNLTQAEKLALRIETLPPGKLVNITVAVDKNGEPVFWTVREEGKAEGIPCEES